MIRRCCTLLSSSLSPAILFSACCTQQHQLQTHQYRGNGGGALFRNTPALLSQTPDWFTARKKKSLQDRERRALLRQGIDPDQDNDDESWVDPEEQARIDAEKTEKETEQRAREEAIREQRDKQDAERKGKFQKFRAAQLATAQKLRAKRKEAEERDEATPAERHRDSRIFVDEVADDTKSKKPATDAAKPIADDDDDATAKSEGKDDDASESDADHEDGDNEEGESKRK